MAEAEQGTVRDGRLVHPMNPERSGVEIKTIRGDYRDADGVNRNRLRLWEKIGFRAAPGRHFAGAALLRSSGSPRRRSARAGRRPSSPPSPRTISPASRQVEAIVRENLARWQDEGLVPDMPIEPGEKTDEPIRTRGWTLLASSVCAATLLSAASIDWNVSSSRCSQLSYCKLLDNDISTLRLESRNARRARRIRHNVFNNQAFNTLSELCA